MQVIILSHTMKNNSVHDANVIRQINGGTVLIPEFDSSCPN